ncbi:MAG: class I SAM-dependent DNA methyltransferase [Limnochordia bacterium]
MNAWGALAAPYERYAEIYDRTGADEFGLQLLRLLTDVLDRHGCQVRSALDLACGTGSVALALARKGISVTGLDLSPQMLARARMKLAAESDLPVSFLHGDMRSFQLPEPVHMVTCWFDAMNYNLRDEDLAATFRCTAACLEKGGLFVFDMNSVHALRDLWGNNVFVEDYGDVVYIWQNEYDPRVRTGTLTATFFVQSGEHYERFTEIHIERGYYMHEVIKFLQEAGFEALEVLCTDGSPAEETDTRHVYVARRI